MPLPYRSRGRHARPGRARRTINGTHATLTIAAAAAAAMGLLLAGHPQLPATAPHCVPWHSCPCRYPGAPIHLNGNQLCPDQDKSTARVVVGGRP
jgi:hypothetical protein